MENELMNYSLCQQKVSKQLDASSWALWARGDGERTTSTGWLVRSDLGHVGGRNTSMLGLFSSTLLPFIITYNSTNKIIHTSMFYCGKCHIFIELLVTLFLNLTVINNLRTLRARKGSALSCVSMKMSIAITSSLVSTKYAITRAWDDHGA